jgi:hypothetical protein
MALTRTVVGTFSKLNAGTAAFVTEEFTPPANSLLVVRVYVMRKEGSSSMGTPLISGGGLAYTHRSGATTALTPAWATTAAWFTAPVGGSPAKMAITVDEASNLNVYEYVVSVIAYTGYDTTTPIGGVLTSGATNIGDGAESRTLSEAPAVADETLLCIDCDATKGPPQTSLETGWSLVHEKSASAESGIAIASRTGSTSTTVSVKDSYNVSGGSFSKAGMGAIVIRAAKGANVVELGRASEAASAQAISPRKTTTLGQATTSSSAQAIAPRKAKEVDRAGDTAAAQAIAPKKRSTIAQVTETETSQVLTPRKRKVVDQVAELAAAQPLTERKARQLDRAVEGDSAQAFGRRKQLAIASVSELAAAQALTVRRAFPLGRATELAAAQGLTARRAKLLDRAVETDTAGGLELLRALGVGRVVETDVALGLTPRKAQLLDQALDVATARPIVPVRLLQLQPVQELDVAGAIALPLPPTPDLDIPLGAILLGAEETSAIQVGPLVRGAICLGVDETGALLLAVPPRGAILLTPSRSALNLGAEETGAIQVGERDRGARLV